MDRDGRRGTRSLPAFLPPRSSAAPARDASALTRRQFGLTLAASGLLGCGRAAAVPVELRVVSLSPSTTEAVFAVGAGGSLVGRSQHCDHPPEVARLPSVGGYAEPDLERVLGLRPTLVIGERGPAGPGLEERLRGQGIATYFPPTGSVAEIGELLATLGVRLGCGPRGAEVRAAMLDAIEHVASWARERPPVRALLVFDARPLYVAGPGGFPDELLRLAGGVNVVRGGGAYPTLDLERLLALDPDVVVDATDLHDGPSKLGDLEGWSCLAAVRAGRVRKLATATALRPGPRLAEGLAAVAQALHGAAPPAAGSVR